MKRWSATLVLMLVVFASAFAQAPGARSQQTQQPSQQPTGTDDMQNDPAATFKVNVKLVNVVATVVDQNGAPVGGLNRDDFRIFENDEPQKIALFDRESGLPLSIVLGLDASLSTRKDLPMELEAARRFARAILRPIDGMSIYQFSQFVDEIQGFTSDLRKIDRSITRVQTGSSTSLYDAIFLGSQALTKRQGRKVMVIITDGGDTTSKSSYQDAIRAAQIADTILYAIIMVPIEASAGRDVGGEHALIQMTRDTGGKYYYATSLDQLEKAFSQISDELRTQYVIAYYPPKKSTGSDFRSIRLELTRPAPDGNEYRVRSRTGYFTSKLE